ncbi:hypothetical protein AX17_003757 [Amanita inopinata Kibby_2008]|nr:hypothetical protein AX17_003757 [Amanita inopinata Kibby_2008]
MRFATIFATAFLVVSGVVAVPYEYNNDMLVARDYYFDARDTVAPIRLETRQPIREGDCKSGETMFTTAHECFNKWHGRGFYYSNHCYAVDDASIPATEKGICYLPPMPGRFRHVVL